ncbi:phosphatase PAP2 family protein [Methanobrevibacter sp.]|uniref:phosphatase PAP2 family protein n=1 Tax=Methanobrevibacter sp. TaxID=66852 RepID=UPI003868E796
MDINLELFYFFNHNLQNPIFDAVMPVITHFGGFKVLVVVLIVIIFYAHLKGKKTLRRITILALIAFLCSDLVTAILKNLVNEPRPFVSLDNVHLLITEDDPLSFPSGHSTSTLSVVTFYILNMKELAKKHYKLIDIALVIFALVIPFSRLYVGVHYPFDVLAGAIIGIIGALVVNRYKNKIIKF